MINLLNYETFFLLYADGELSPAEQEAVLKFVEQHPLLEEDFNRIKTLKFSPDKGLVMMDKSALRMEIPEEVEADYSFEPDLSIVYPNKGELYRKGNVLPLYWLRMVSVAAAILFTMGIVWLVMGDKENDAFIAMETLGKPGSSSTGTTAQSSPKSTSPSSEDKMVASTTNFSHQSVGESPSSKMATSYAVSSEKPVGTEDPQEQITVELQQTTAIAAPQFVAPDLSAASSIQQASVPQKGNFSEAALLAAAERMAISAAPMASEPNASLLINAALKEDKKSGFRSILRTINRRLLNEHEPPQDKKFIQVANFYIPVNK
jgi:anti-sigma factor RsiW